MTWPTTARDLLGHLGPALADDYRIERELGAGATAKVYLAHDLKHDRLVALKVLRPELALAVGADRFLREIQTAARLSHPGILPLYDSGEANGALFFTMPFVDGESLRDRLERDGPLPVDEAVRIASDVADALGYAHSCGVIHRDVKPENILLAGGRPLVADFGIALAVEEAGDERLTRTGMVVGTPAYMSPEQSAGSATLDGRTDIYSLACVLYEMLAGRPPFVGDSLHAIVARQRAEQPAPVRTLRGDVPPAIEATLADALAKDPNDRFATTADFAAALVDPARRSRWQSRHRARRARSWLAAGAVVALVGVVVAKTVYREGPAPLRERDWVLVADFEGPREDPTLARAVRELVTTELNQSRYLSTMPRQQLAGTLRAAGLPETTTVNVDLARELALRTAVRAVVTGTVDTSSAGYALALRVVDASDGREIAAASATSAADSVVPTVQRLGRRLRATLGEQRGALEANQLLLDIATPSLPAYRLYVDAEARLRLGDAVGTAQALRQAVALDTGFAAAWAMIGMNFVAARDLDSASLAFREALRRPARLSIAQQYRLRADAAYAIDHDIPEAIRWYDRYLALTPRSTGGRNNRGLYLSMLGRYEDALVDFEQAAANNPFGPRQAQPAIVNATDMLVALGRTDRASAKARDLTGTYAQYAAIRLAAIGGRWSEADSIAAHALATANVAPGLALEATTTRAALLALHGRVAAADRALAEAVQKGSVAQRRWFEQARTLLAMASERPAPAMSRELASDESPGGLVTRGMRLAVLGDTVGARKIERRLMTLTPAQRVRLGSGRHVVDALIEARRGRWAQVVSTLGPVALAGEHDASSLDHVPSLTMRWIVADAYARLGQTDSAIATMEQAVSYERVPPGHLSLRGFIYPFAMHRLATWHARRGDASASRRTWAAFAAAFDTPDLSVRSMRDDVPDAAGRVPNATSARTRRASTP